MGQRKKVTAVTFFRCPTVILGGMFTAVPRLNDPGDMYVLHVIILFKSQKEISTVIIDKKVLG